MGLRTKVVPLATYPNEMEAQMIAQILEENDIPAIVKPLGGGYGGLGVTQFIHHRVYVAEENLEKAQQIIEFDEEEPTEDFRETNVS